MIQPFVGDENKIRQEGGFVYQPLREFSAVGGPEELLSSDFLEGRIDGDGIVTEAEPPLHLVVVLVHAGVVEGKFQSLGLAPFLDLLVDFLEASIVLVVAIAFQPSPEILIVLFEELNVLREFLRQDFLGNHPSVICVGLHAHSLSLSLEV